MSNDIAIQTSALCKRFRNGVTAVDHLDIAIPPGTVYGMLGRNGAGKTTAIRLLAGLLQPTSGTATILGHNMARATSDNRARFAYVSQHQTLPSWMSVTQLCESIRRLYPGWDETYAIELMHRFALDSQIPIAKLSGGDQRKAALLAAFSSGAEVLLLDEPAGGLDPLARRQLVDVIVDAAAESPPRTILFSTHIVSDLERVAEHVAILDHGHVRIAARVDALQDEVKRLHLTFPHPVTPTEFTVPGTIQADYDGFHMTAIVRLQNSDILDQLRSTPGLNVASTSLGLEEIFIHLNMAPTHDRNQHDAI